MAQEPKKYKHGEKISFREDSSLMHGESSSALNQNQDDSSSRANVVFRAFKASESIETRTVITLFGREIKNQDIISKVRVGLPIKSIDRVAKKMELLDVVFVLRFIGMSDRTYQRRKNENKALSSIQSDRLYRLAKIEARAVDVLGDDKTASDWMKTPNRALGAAPLDLLDTEAGKDQVERVLTRIEYGVYS